jgi:hypothetical protein
MFGYGGHQTRIEAANFVQARSLHQVGSFGGPPP